MTSEGQGARVIELPPRQTCPICGIPLRPARWTEIQQDLVSSDPQIRQFAESTAQGRRDWQPPEHFSDWQKFEAQTQCPSWQFRCDRCGHRLLWSRERSDSGVESD